MKNDSQKGFTVFDDLPGVDPAVESLLGQGQRRQIESHLPKNERSQKKKSVNAPKTQAIPNPS